MTLQAPAVRCDRVPTLRCSLLRVSPGGPGRVDGAKPNMEPASRYCALSSLFTGSGSSAVLSSQARAPWIALTMNCSTASTACRSLRAPTARSPASRKRFARRALRSICASATL